MLLGKWLGFSDGSRNYNSHWRGLAKEVATTIFIGEGLMTEVATTIFIDGVLATEVTTT